MIDRIHTGVAQTGEVVGVAGAHLLHGGNICAGDKGLFTGAGENHGALLGDRRRGFEGVFQFHQNAGVERIERLRPVDGQDRVVIAMSDLDDRHSTLQLR